MLETRNCGTDNCDRWIGNAIKSLEFPIVEDFTGDGIKDLVGRTYTHYFGVLLELNNDEKNVFLDGFC